MKYHRRSIRLNEFDYSNGGYYFVTVCCQNRINHFCNVGAGLVPALMVNKMILNYVGKMVDDIILNYFNKNKLIDLDEFIIMPDHIHMIVVIKKQFNKNIVNGNNGGINKMSGDEINTRAGTRPAPTLEPNKTLGTIIGELKSLITNGYIKNIKQNNWPRFDKRLWQRNYYERIIRNEKEYFAYKKYIKDNPINFLIPKTPPKGGV